MHTITGVKPMRTSEVIKIHHALDGYEPRGKAFDLVLEETQIDPARLRELLDKYHFYFTPVGDSGRYIVNRQHYNKGSLYTVVDSIERRNINYALAKFTPLFFIGLIFCSATVGFMLSAIVNRHGGYF